jgi:hypothetical protein
MYERINPIKSKQWDPETGSLALSLGPPAKNGKGKAAAKNGGKGELGAGFGDFGGGAIGVGSITRGGNCVCSVALERLVTEQGGLMAKSAGSDALPFEKGVAV